MERKIGEIFEYNGEWFKATDENGKFCIGLNIDPMYCHKATVSEIIEHFK